MATRKGTVNADAKQDRVPILEVRDARGRLLYRRTGGGNLARNYQVRQSVKEQVRDRDGRRCVLCGHRPEAKYELEVDHIIPYRDGGPNTPDNLRSLCRPLPRASSGPTRFYRLPPGEKRDVLAQAVARIYPRALYP